MNRKQALASAVFVAGFSVALVGCHTANQVPSEHFDSARFGMVEPAINTFNSGDFEKFARTSPPNQASIKVEGRYQTVILSNPVSRREVFKLQPQPAVGSPTRDYQVVVAENRRLIPLNPLNWQPAPVMRLFDATGRSNNTQIEPAVELLDSGTIVATGTAPIIIVKKTTVSSEGTKFSVEATPNGWILAVFEATSPVLVYRDNSTSAVSVPQGKVLIVTADDTLGTPVINDEVQAKMRDYANALLGTAGLPLIP